MKYRLGIDLGTNSIGWAAIQLSEENEPRQLIDVGVRIFSDSRNPKDKSSNAAQRRAPRAMRRNRDRKLQRGRRLMNALVRGKLMPVDPRDRKRLETEDPWVLRAKALDERLSLHQTGRAIYHLGLRRGFKSNRKTDGDEAGKVYDAIARTTALMAETGTRTVGELFGAPRRAQQQENDKRAVGDRKPLPQARVRLHGTGAKLAYDYYPQRDVILNEFDAIWTSQSEYHDELTTDLKNCLRGIISHQRPLKSPPVGRCAFLHDELRASKALPDFQKFRILQDVNNLQVGTVGQTTRPLTEPERAELLQFLLVPSSKSARRSFDQIRKKLGLEQSQRFNLESEKRKHLNGDQTAARMMQSDAWGPDWFKLSMAEQSGIIQRVIDEEDNSALANWFADIHGLEPELAQQVAKVRLPQRYGHLSASAIGRLLPHLAAGRRYDEAASFEFASHSQLADGEIHDDGLPYYGEVLRHRTAFQHEQPRNVEEAFGKVANPTVHVALNELRKVINDLIQRYGEPPEQVVLELARDLPLSAERLNQLERTQKANQEANERRRTQLAGLGQIDSHDNRLRLRLFEEYEATAGLPVQCVFTGQVIGITDLLSAEIEIEHILPESRTLDDSIANKVLATRRANRDKGNRTPFEAFGSSHGEYDWEAISRRAEFLPANKRWRFSPTAMERFENEGRFLDRHLNDTRYIARLGKEFVEALYGGQGRPGQPRSVWVVQGRLTADLRHYAGFNGLLSDDNRKDRTDHRHHAIDALIVALTEPAMIKRAASLAKTTNTTDHHHQIMSAMAEPLQRYRRSLDDRLHKLTVSHKPDHGIQSAMHNDTAYGLTGDTDKKGQPLLVARKAIASFERADQLAAIRDAELRRLFQVATKGLTDKKTFSEALQHAAATMSPPVRSARVLTPMKETAFVTITHGDGHVKAYKGDSNYCYEVWRTGKGVWTGEIITTFQAYQRTQHEPDWWKRLEGAGGQKLIMRVRKGDMLELDGPTSRQRVIVYKFSIGQIYMVEHFEGNAPARVKAKELKAVVKSPSTLQKLNARTLTVSPSGRVSRA